jgi:hypothetical protein
MTKVWMVHAGNTELQVPHHVLYQHSIQCHGVLHYYCAAISFTSSNKKKVIMKLKVLSHSDA